MQRGKIVSFDLFLVRAKSVRGYTSLMKFSEAVHRIEYFRFLNFFPLTPTTAKAENNTFAKAKLKSNFF